jgi:hypothetical protein
MSPAWLWYYHIAGAKGTSHHRASSRVASPCTPFAQWPNASPIASNRRKSSCSAPTPTAIPSRRATWTCSSSWIPCCARASSGWRSPARFHRVHSHSMSSSARRRNWQSASRWAICSYARLPLRATSLQGNGALSLAPPLYVLAGIRFSITRTTSANPTVITRYRYATTLYVSKNRNVLAEYTFPSCVMS